MCLSACLCAFPLTFFYLAFEFVASFQYKRLNKLLFFYNLSFLLRLSFIATLSSARNLHTQVFCVFKSHFSFFSMLSFQKHLCSGISDLRFNVAALSEGMADKNLDGVDMVLDCQPSECRGKRVIAAPSAFPNTTVELDGSEKEHQHVKHSNYKISDPLPFPYSTSAQWETLQNVMVDQGPLFLSCSIVDQKSKQLLAVTSLEKNRFSELVRFDMGQFITLWCVCVCVIVILPQIRHII